MSIISDKNRDLVFRYVDAFNRGDLDALQSLFAPNAMIQGVLEFVPIAEALPIWGELHAAFGIELTVESLVAESDKVAALYTERGKFRGPFRGKGPTGKSYQLVAMEWFTICDSLIARRWGARDSAAQAKQIGM
jgi:predicted ester cyclase